MSLQVREDPSNLWGMPVYEDTSNGGALLVTVNNGNRWAVPIRYVPRGTGGAVPINYAGAGFVAPPAPPTATLLDSVDFTDPGDVDSFERSQAAGYTGSGDADAFQREVAVDVLRSSHYQSSQGPLVLLEDDPTQIQLVGVTNLMVVPGVGKFSASWDNPAVMANVGTIKYKIDSGSYGDAGLVNSLTDISCPPGTHTVTIKLVSDISDTDGAEVTSDEFEVTAPGATLVFEEHFTGVANGTDVNDLPNWNQDYTEYPDGLMTVFGLGLDFAYSNATAKSVGLYNTNLPSGVDQRMEFTFTSGAGNSFVGVMMRGSTAANRPFISMRYNILQAGMGAFSVLDSTTSWATGTKFAIECTGTGASTRLRVQVDTGSGWTDVPGWESLDPGPSNYNDNVGAFGIIGYDLGSGTGIDDIYAYDLA